MNFVTVPARKGAQGQATFTMANLRQKTTGLPFIVFISQKDDARHAARVKVSPEPKVKSGEMGSYSIEPFRFRTGIRLASHDETLLNDWINLNRAVLKDYWDGAIAYTEDAIDRIKSI